MKPLLFFLFLYLALPCHASIEKPKSYLPQGILQLDDYFSHHLLVAEKSTHRLYLFSNDGSHPRLLKVYPMATGKKTGDKIYRGDHRTPEGVYRLYQFLPHQNLMKTHGEEGKIYGVGAFVLNYPNPIDHQKGKSGSGIWLHSTNDESRIGKGLDSRGCIVTFNSHLIEISKYIELHRTPFIVVHDLTWLDKKTWQRKRDELQKMISTWLQAWQSEDLKTYLDSYHQDFKDPIRGNLPRFKYYKKRIFQKPGTPQISIDHLGLLQSKDYVVATFRQSYTSDTVKDVGKKTLYLKRDQFYHWKIIAEVWSKAGIHPNTKEAMAFRPSMRFFETDQPSQILGSYLVKAHEKGRSPTSPEDPSP